MADGGTIGVFDFDIDISGAWVVLVRKPLRGDVSATARLTRTSGSSRKTLMGWRDG